jgi:hypothetical protein
MIATTSTSGDSVGATDLFEQQLADWMIPSLMTIA